MVHVLCRHVITAGHLWARRKHLNVVLFKDIRETSERQKENNTHELNFIVELLLKISSRIFILCHI